MESPPGAFPVDSRLIAFWISSKVGTASSDCMADGNLGRSVDGFVVDGIGAVQNSIEMLRPPDEYIFLLCDECEPVSTEERG